MKKILSVLVIVAFASCTNTDQKDEAADANKIKLVIDAVAVDNNDTETPSGVSVVSVPKN